MPALDLPILSARDLAFGYGDTTVLTSVTLTLEAGEVLAIVGSSGAGKTSLLLCLSGLVQPHAGSIEFRGQRVDALRTRDRDRLRRSSFGFVFQHGDLVPELTVAENVTLPLRLQGCSASQAFAAATAQLGELGVAHLASRRVSEISGGEVQRAAIARALVHDPSLIFADEPTGALDEDNASTVADLLLSQTRAHQAGVILVTHNSGMAARADRVVRLDAGRLASCS